MLPRSAAEAALASLLGMGLDYAPSLDRHDTRRKIGVITRADIVGKRLELGGYLFAKDFPEIVREIGLEKESAAIIGPDDTSAQVHLHASVPNRRVGTMRGDVV